MVRVGADTKQMERGLNNARAKMKAFSGQIKKMGKVMAVAGAAVVGAIGMMVKSYIKAGDEVHKMALRTGFSTEALSELKYAAEISGTTLESLEKGVKKMAKTIQDASDGLMTYVRAFDRIGLKAEELMELSPEDQFDRIARAIASLESPTIRAATAQEIFGRAGTQLLPLFAAGEEGLEKLRKKAHELGIVFDQEAANKAAALTDALTTLKGSIKGVTMGMAEEMVPVLTVLVEAVAEAMSDIRGDTKAMASSVLGFFKIIAQGVMGLMLAFHEFQRGVFQMGEGIMLVLREYVGKLIIGYGMLSKIIPAFGDNVRELMKLYKNLYIIERGYIDQQNEQIDQQMDIVFAFEKLFMALDQAAESYKKVVDEGAKLPGSFESTALKARDFHGALDQVQGSLESYVFATEKVKTANEMLMESWRLTSEAQLKFSQIAMGEFMAMEASLKGFVGAILGTLEKWAIGEIIPRVMAALPFPLNLLAVGGAIAAIKTLFSALKSFKEGGFVERETIARLHPGEYVVSAPDVKALTSPAGAPRMPPTVYATVNIYPRNLDDRAINRTAEKIFRRLDYERGRYG